MPLEPRPAAPGANEKIIKRIYMLDDNAKFSIKADATTADTQQEKELTDMVHFLAERFYCKAAFTTLGMIIAEGTKENINQYFEMLDVWIEENKN